MLTVELGGGVVGVFADTGHDDRGGGGGAEPTTML
jgi:hypothetical protein